MVGAADLNRDERAAALCFSADGVISRAQFAGDVAAFRSRIQGASHVCNLLADRYEFMVGLAATFLNGQIALLPSAPAPGAVARALEGAGRAIIVGGDHGSHPETASPIDPAETFAALRAATGRVNVFTSGSTAHPVRHVKSWGTLAGGAAVTEAIMSRLGMVPGHCAILGTTPHQHMYGLEAAVFTGLAFGHCLHRETVFYPADLERAVSDAAALGIERLVLVSSPAHLKFLEDTLASLPRIQGVISATAPLSPALAERLEARGDLQVWEIYGSTETGSLAIRRTTGDERWEPLVGFTLSEQEDGFLAKAPHLETPFVLPDVIEQETDGRFRLLGRRGEMVSVAGKRSSLAALNAVLLETEGLSDGVVLQHRTEGDDILCVIAVLGDLNESDAKPAIRRQFRQHLDPVFTPKRMAFVERLPRSGTGKIMAKDAEELLKLVGLT